MFQVRWIQVCYVLWELKTGPEMPFGTGRGGGVGVGEAQLPRPHASGSASTTPGHLVG